MSYEKFCCERCDEIFMIPEWVSESSSDIVSLCDMGINPDVDFVCVDCLTSEESDKVDAYLTEKMKKIS